MSQESRDVGDYKVKFKHVFSLGLCGLNVVPWRISMYKTGSYDTTEAFQSFREDLGKRGPDA